MLSVAVVAIGIAAELLDVPGQEAAQQVKEVQRIRRSASRVVIGKQIAGRMVVGQALRLLVAAALRAAFQRTRVQQSKMRFAQRSGYSLTDRNRSAFAITETELKLIAAPAIIGLRRMPNSG